MQNPKILHQTISVGEKDLFGYKEKTNNTFFFFNPFPNLLKIFKHFLVCWQQSRNIEKQAETQLSKNLSIGCQKFWRTAKVLGWFSLWSLLLGQVNKTKRKKILITVFMWFTVQWIQKPSNQFNNFSFSSRKQHIINWPLWTALGYPKHYGKYGLYLPNRMISKIGPVGIGKFVYTFPHSISSQQSKRYISALG